MVATATPPSSPCSGLSSTLFHQVHASAWGAATEANGATQTSESLVVDVAGACTGLLGAAVKAGGRMDQTMVELVDAAPGQLGSMLLTLRWVTKLCVAIALTIEVGV